jgi:hypothetical protein
MHSHMPHDADSPHHAHIPSDIDPTVRKLLTAFMQFRKVTWANKPAFGCTPGELRVLFCVHHGRKQGGPDLKVSDISRMHHVATTTVNHLVNRL